MSHITDQSTETLLRELDMADMATAVTKGHKLKRWIAYRSAILAELTKRNPVSPETAALTDDELLKELTQ